MFVNPNSAAPYAAAEGDPRKQPVEWQGAADVARAFKEQPVTETDQRRALTILRGDLAYAKDVGGVQSVLIRMDEASALAELLPDNAPERVEVELAAERAKGKAEAYGQVNLKALEALVSNAARQLGEAR